MKSETTHHANFAKPVSRTRIVAMRGIGECVAQEFLLLDLLWKIQH